MEILGACGGFDEVKVVESSSRHVRIRPNAPDRAKVAETLLPLRLTDAAAQDGLIELMEWLVEPARAAEDAQTALRLVKVLGAAPQYADDLRQIAERAYQRRGQLTEQQGRVLRQAGVEVDSGWFRQSVWERVRNTVGR
jgi:hypothetical protein